MEVRPVESGSACRSERSNSFSVLYGPRFKNLRQSSNRTAEPAPMGIREIDHIWLLSLRRRRVVFRPSAVWALEPCSTGAAAKPHAWSRSDDPALSDRN